MAFWGDYHTHTVYSRGKKKLHGKGSVLENAEAAKAAGLKELAITDHGFRHVYGVRGNDAFDALKAECAAAEAQTGIKIYCGLENNLDPKSGKKSKKGMATPPFIELSEGIMDELQIVQGGYHAFIGNPRLLGNMLFWTRNVVFKFLPWRKKLIAQNTAAYKRIIDEYPIDFIGHLNRGIMADAVEVAKYAHEHGVYIELNGRHKSLTKKEIKAMVDVGVEFICNSDAHVPTDVGKMTYGLEIIKDCEIPYSQIANWERLPDFRSQQFKNARSSKEEIGE
ncbi:MAG: PHP domain-containing protein [Clostridiales bacterium]|nr:PHP domain-containing protein [Clostridiales bacterium]